MACSNRILTRPGVAALVLGAVAAHAIPARSDAVVRVTRSIDWTAAEAAAAEVTGRSAAVVRAAPVAAGMNRAATVRLPVLVPDDASLAPRASLMPQGDSYSYESRVGGAKSDPKIALFGTRLAVVPPDAGPFAAAAPAAGDSGYQIDRSSDGDAENQGEASVDIAFERYGASYLLRVTCSTATDERCRGDEFGLALARSLIVVGGAPAP